MARLSAEHSGLGVSVQDGGRFGFRGLGVPVSGALDQSWRAAANVLAGAPEDAAAFEILLAAPVLRVEQGPVRVGLVGALSGVLTREGVEERTGCWRGLLLQTGDRALSALKILRAPAYIAFSGGLDAPVFLGSRSTYARANLGRALCCGDALCCGEASGDDFFALPLAPGEGPLRFIPGPQDFPLETLAAFVDARWTVRPESDRMGLPSPAHASRMAPAAPTSSATASRPARSRFPATASRSFCVRMDRLPAAMPRSAA